MKKAFALLTCLACLVAQLGAQSAAGTQKRFRFQSYNSFGVIAGASNTDLLVQTVNGVRFSKWFVGAGVGLDAYRLRSIPIFLDVRAFPIKGRHFFFYGDAGIHLPWVKEKEDIPFNPEPDYLQGLYYDGGFGYGFPFGLRNALVLSAGFTEKRHAEETKSTGPCLVPPCPEFLNRYDYKLRRLSFKLGVMF